MGTVRIQHFQDTALYYIPFQYNQYLKSLPNYYNCYSAVLAYIRVSTARYHFAFFEQGQQII